MEKEKEYCPNCEHRFSEDEYFNQECKQCDWPFLESNWVDSYISVDDWEEEALNHTNDSKRAQKK